MSKALHVAVIKNGTTSPHKQATLLPRPSGPNNANDCIVAAVRVSGNGFHDGMLSVVHAPDGCAGMRVCSRSIHSGRATQL